MNYGYSSHYLSTPALRQDPILNLTKVELELMACICSLKKVKMWTFLHF